MYKVIETIFGIVVANRLRLILGDTQRNPIVSVVKHFYAGYMIWFNKSSDYMKLYLVIAPFFNLFIFSGFFSFVFIMLSNFYIFKSSISKV